MGITGHCNGTHSQTLSVKSCSQYLRLVSPHIGSLSDKYGRRRVLLITMIGNILSALVYVLTVSPRHAVTNVLCSWIQSSSFASYMLSRVIGGLSEGNVQLAMFVSPRSSLLLQTYHAVPVVLSSQISLRLRTALKPSHTSASHLPSASASAPRSVPTSLRGLPQP